jgi:hypothetical protein
MQDHLAVRLKPDEIDRIKAVQGELSTEWHPATISDALRALILAGLAVYEAKRKARDTPPPNPRRARSGKRRKRTE